MLYPSLVQDLEDRERHDLLEDFLEFEVMKLLVLDVSTPLFSILSPLAFVANDTSEGIASKSKTMS